MKEFTYTITDEQGIHARPAGLLVKEAAGFASAITIEKDGKKVDAKRILGFTDSPVRMHLIFQLLHLHLHLQHEV